MRRLSLIIVVFASLLSSCKKSDSSSVTTFLTDEVEIDPFTDQSYLKVVDGSNVYYFNDNIPDTLGFAVDTLNKFQDKNGNIVDTLWLTKDYADFGDTTSEGFKEVFIHVEKYDRGHTAPPFNFTYNLRNTVSSSGTLDLAGDYRRSGSPVTITKISNGNFVLSNAFVPPRVTPVMIYVDGSNVITIPDVKTGAYDGSYGSVSALTVRQASFYNIRYSQIGGTPGTGDTLVVTVKRTDVAGAITKFIRQ